MKEKKFKTLLPTRRKCCLKNFLKLEFLAKYGSITVIIFFTLLQSYNITKGENFSLVFISILINIFFLFIVLIKIDFIKIDFFKIYVDSFLKFIIFAFLLNFVMYLFVDNIFYKYLYAPISFLGAYFTFLLLKKDSL